MKSKFVIIWLGRVSYGAARQFIREKLHPLTRQGRTYLVFCQHFPVLTLGKNMTILERKEAIKAISLSSNKPECVAVDRGGKATYHDLNQLMVYPVAHLPSLKVGVRTFIELSLGAISSSIAQLGATVEIDSCLRGLWIKQKKVAAVGFRILEGLSDHGIALYLRRPADEFSLFNPCGELALRHTSLQDELNVDFKISLLTSIIRDQFQRAFGQ